MKLLREYHLTVLFIPLLYISIWLAAWLVSTFAHAVTSPTSMKQLPPPKPTGIEGYYRVTGKSDEGKAYNGIGVIAKRGDGYFAVWDFEKNKVEGLGVRQGNSLALAWDQDAFGVCCFTITYTKGIPRLDGCWTGVGSRAVCEEHWVWLRELP